MPAKDDANLEEAGTIDDRPYEPPDTEELLEIIKAQQRMIDDQDERMRRIEDGSPRVIDPYEMQAPELAEGFKRYASLFGEQTYIIHPGDRVLVNGVPFNQRAVQIDFSGHVYETDDAEKQAWLDDPKNKKEQEQAGVPYWEAPDAVRRHTNVEVVEGLRASEQAVRVPLEVPLP